MSISVIYNIKRIKALWEKLYEANSEMSFYQSFYWNYCLDKRTRLKNIKKNNAIIEYVICNERMIAPLVVNKKEKTVFILGYEDSSDYLSFIYNSNDIETISRDIGSILNCFKGYKFIVNKINQNMSMYRAVEMWTSSSTAVLEKKSSDCVYINTNYIGTIYDTMTKSSRQNYRTSLNRLKKDNKSYRVEFKFSTLSKEFSLELYKLYCLRRNDCSENKKKRFDIGKIKRILKTTKFGMNADVLSKYGLTEPVFWAGIYIDNVLAAFCEGAYTNDKKRLCISRVATNPDFYIYSPGIIMFVDIIDKLRDDIDLFDLTRGDEDYKFKLGGVVHNNYSFLFEL